MLNKKYLPLLLLLVITTNVLLIKWANTQYSKSYDGKYRLFQHPFVQTMFLFLGEFSCLLIYKIIFMYLSRRRDFSEDNNFLTEGERQFSPFVFFLPSLCNVISTSLLFMGLILSYPSSFQLLKGISLVFVGIFSFSYLEFILTLRHWFGILIIIISTILTCISDVNNFNLHPIDDRDTNAILTADLLIIISQVFRALQMVYEDKYLKTLNIPLLQIIGWEGIYGLLITIIVIIPMNFIECWSKAFCNNSHNVFEDIIDAFVQLFNSPILIVIHILFIQLIIIESYLTKYIIKDASSTAIVTINVISVTFIWLLSLGIGWEYFYYLEFLALCILYCGFCVYKNVVFPQIYRFIIINLFRRNFNNDVEEVINQPADAVI